jgi:hypothetical protein
MRRLHSTLFTLLLRLLRIAFALIYRLSHSGDTAYAI